MKSSSSFLASLRHAAEKGWPVDVEQTFQRTDGRRGYVVAVTSEVLLLQVVDDQFGLNGCALMPINAIDRSRRMREQEELMGFLVDRKSGKSILADLKLQDKDLTLRRFLRSYLDRDALVTIHRGWIDETICFVGQVRKVGKKSVQLREVSPEGEWIDGLMKLQLDDITRVDVEGGYEKGLWAYATRDGKLGDGGYP